MPELPEVQTIADELRPLLRGRTFVDLWVDHPPMLRQPRERHAFLGRIRNKTVHDVGRRGKFVWLRLTGSQNIFVHQKFGHLVFGRWKRTRGAWVPADALTTALANDPLTKFLRIVFTFENGAMLALADIRKFGRAYAVRDDDIKHVPELAVGLDPIAPGFDFRTLKPMLQRRSISIKQALLDQRLIGGIGNIYADEILWHARVSPFKGVKDLTESEYKKIHHTIPLILQRAISAKGASMLNYRRPNGEEGGYGALRYVYHREGEPCQRCKNKIQRIVIQGRSAHFCAICQSEKS